MDKQEKIKSIKNLIDNYGCIDINKIDYEYPVISSIEDQSVMVEGVNDTGVYCTEYVNKTEVNNHYVLEFNQLNDNTLDEIFEIATNYGISQEILFNSFRSDDFYI